MVNEGKETMLVGRIDMPLLVAGAIDCWKDFTTGGIRAAEIDICPKSALDFGSDSRRGKGGIIALRKPCRNTEAGPKDKQDWMIICFRGP